MQVKGGGRWKVGTGSVVKGRKMEVKEEQEVW